MKAIDAAAIAAPRRVTDFLALTKARVNVLVVATTWAGYYLAADTALDYQILINTLIGTALVAAGAAALNQVLERDADALMVRTQHRPVADGRLLATEATQFALALSVTGLLLLAFGASVVAALIAMVTLLTYTLVYTPLKRRTSHALLVGAVPGALPPLIGWAAVDGTLPLLAWVPVLIVFVWQIPHFLSIAWLYRDDYERAGFPVLPVLEPDGRRTARYVLTYTVLLLIVSTLPAVLGLSGSMYLVGALVLGSAFFAIACRFAASRTTATARALFLASIVYLPLVWILMVIDKK